MTRADHGHATTRFEMRAVAGHLALEGGGGTARGEAASTTEARPPNTSAPGSSGRSRVAKRPHPAAHPHPAAPPTRGAGRRRERDER